MTEPQTLAELRQTHSPAQLIQQWRSLRARHWDALVRLVMSVCPGDVDAHGGITWSAVTPRDLELPVTRDALRAWLAARPPHGAVTLLSAMLDPRDPRDVTWRDAIDLAREVYPEAVADLVPSMSTDPFDAARARYAGVALGDALAERKRRAPESGIAGHLRFADAAALLRVLERAGDTLVPHEFREVGRLLAAAPETPEGVAPAYDRALAAQVSSLTKREANELFAWTRLASTAGLVAALRGPAKNVAVLERLVNLVASQGTPHGADALAQVLDHKKLGARAALGLAAMGPVGVEAVRRRLDAGPFAHDAGRRHAAVLTSLPAPDASLWDGEWFGFPRFGRAPEDDLLTGYAWPAAPTHAPTAVELLEAAVKEKPARDLLPPTGWADLVQLAAIDPWFVDVRAAHATALRLGRLGHGRDPGALASAIDALTWGGSITTRHPPSDWGYGYALLWADCDERVFRHAIARHQGVGAGHWIGSLDRHFVRAVAAEKPPWAAYVTALLWFLDANIASGAWCGAPRRIAALDAPAPTATLTPEGTSLWVHATLDDVDRATLRLRGDCVITVDVRARTWEVTLPKGAKGATGATPSRADGRSLRLAVETARDMMYVGIDGAMVHGPFTKLPMTVAPVEVRAEGEGARVTTFTLHQKATVREAEAVSALLANPDAPQGWSEVAGQGSPAAAHLLAVVARLDVAPWSKLAADALATMKGEAVAPWRDASPFDEAAGNVPAAPAKPAKKRASKPEAPAPETPAVELPMAFTVRSFEDVVRTFELMALTGKSRGRKPATLHRAKTASNRHEFASFSPKGATEDWGARSAVPHPVVYLGAEAPDTDKVAYFASQLCDLPGLCRKGRGTWARGAWVVEKGRFVVASFDVFPPEDDCDEGPLWHALHAAAWKVSEGWAWALTATSVDDLARLVGVRALPPQVAWTSVDRVVLGDW